MRFEPINADSFTHALRVARELGIEVSDGIKRKCKGVYLVRVK